MTKSEVDDKKEIALRHLAAMQVSVSLVRQRGSTRRLSTGCIRRSVSVVCDREVVGYRGNIYLCTTGDCVKMQPRTLNVGGTSNYII